MSASAKLTALWNLAIELHRQCRYAEALDCMAAIEPLMPDSPVVLAGLGVVLRDHGDLAGSERRLRRLCAISPADPKAHYELALTLLRAGRYPEGFREYEWRWQVPQFADQRREFSQPLWNGEPLDGRRILLWGEQGAGDAVQFVRYAPLVRRAGGDVVIEALPHLERLMTFLDAPSPVVNALTRGVRFDVHCPLMSLPRRFETALGTIPAAAAFQLPAPLTEKWTARLRGAGRSAGLVWSGNPRQSTNAARSIPPGCLLPLARIEGVRFYSLQVGPSAVGAPAGIESLAGELTDFAETAAAIAALDLVITVDTAVAHLAGSLGKPVWLLLAHAADWRWLLDRADSPWYPSMRLFRQPRPREWDEVIARVAAGL